VRNRRGSLVLRWHHSARNASELLGTAVRMCGGPSGSRPKRSMSSLCRRAGLLATSAPMTDYFSVMLDRPRGGRGILLSAELCYATVAAGVLMSPMRDHQTAPKAGERCGGSLSACSASSISYVRRSTRSSIATSPWVTCSRTGGRRLPSTVSGRVRPVMTMC